MYMKANEGKLRRDEGIPDEKVMAFDPRDFLPSDIALEMEEAEVTAREAVVAHAVDSGPVPTSIHVSPDPKLDTNPDVNEAPSDPVRKYITLVKHSSIELSCQTNIGRIPLPDRSGAETGSTRNVYNIVYSLLNHRTKYSQLTYYSHPPALFLFLLKLP